MSDVFRVPLLENFIAWLGTYVPVTAERIQVWFVQSGQSVLRTLVLASGAIFAGALGVVARYFLTLFLLFFFLRDGEIMIRRALRLIPMDAGRKALLVDHLSAVSEEEVSGLLGKSVATPSGDSSSGSASSSG